MRYILGFAFLVIAAAVVFLAARWIEENYVSRPDSVQPVGPFHNPAYRQTAENAERQYLNLSVAEQTAFRRNLEQNIVSIDRWLDWIRESEIRVLCVGEDHVDATRQFLADTLFSEISVDTLLLEVTPHQLGIITQELRQGRRRVLLLEADISAIIRAARRRNPDVQLVGIEETKRQRIVRKNSEKPGTRDESIHSNFWRHYYYGRRHVVLFGALHCTNRAQWLYGRIRRAAPRRVANELVNIRVMEEHQDGRVEAFIYFLDKIGVHRKDFVIIDSKMLHPRVYEWFEFLGVTLKDFTSLVVFADRLKEINV